MQSAHYYEYIFWLFSQHNGCAIYGKQVAYVEFANKLHPNFSAIYLKIHTSEMAFQNSCLEVCHASGRVGFDSCLAVLYHNHAVLVVSICNGESCLWKTVEECFLGITVVLECLVIVEMVTGQVGKDTACEIQTADTLLCNSMRRTFHECIFASCLYHFPKKFIQFYRVRCGVVCWYCLVFNIVAYCRKKTAFMTELSEHII